MATLFNRFLCFIGSHSIPYDYEENMTVDKCERDCPRALKARAIILTQEEKDRMRSELIDKMKS